MNRCITKGLAHLSCRCLLTSSSSQRLVANPGLVRAVWTSACSRALRRPTSALSAHLRHLSTRLNSVVARRPRRASGGGGGRWRVRLPGPLSDKNVERCGFALAASWFTLLSVQSECDQVDFDLLVRNKILNPDEEQTGWERLAAMYTLDEMGGLTPELELVSSIATAGLLVGGTLGAMLNSRLAIVKFVERNQATPFESQLAAKRALQDRVTLGMARGFFMFGWRTALFTSAFTLVSTTLMVYTNQISALHYACGGIFAGALYKTSMGLRGMTAGAVAGGLLGLIGGGVFSLTCYLTDTTLPKLRYQQYLWKYQQALRDQARAERKREKRRLEAEKKLEAQKEELTQSGPQETVAVPVRDPGSSREPMTQLGSGSSEEAAAGGQGRSDAAVAAADAAAAAVAAAAAADAAADVAGTEAPSGATGAVEALRAS